MTLHDSEQTVARIRNDGGWDQRFGKRCEVCGAPKHKPIYAVPRKPNADSASLREFAAALMVCLLVGIAFFLWAGILSVATVPMP